MRKCEIKPGQGKRLRECIRYANTTQEKLAEAIFTTPQTISKIVNEKCPLSNENAVRISRTLKVRLEYLLLEDDYMTSDELIHECSNQRYGRVNSCQSLIESLGYSFITLKENADGSKESMHRPIKKLVINDDDTPSQIIEKAAISYPVRVYIMEASDGRSVYVEQDEYFQLLRDIEDYTHMKCEKIFHQIDHGMEIMKNIKKGNKHRGNDGK